MKEGATSDEQRDKTTVKAISGGMVNLVVQQMMHYAEDDTLVSGEENAFAATSDSESLVETRSRRWGRTAARKLTRRSYHRAAAANTPPPTQSTMGPCVEDRSHIRAPRKLELHEVNPTDCKWCKICDRCGLMHGPPRDVPNSKSF